MKTGTGCVGFKFNLQHAKGFGLLIRGWLRPVRAQDIAAAEEEGARKRVGAAAAAKQLEKLRKDIVKSQADADRVEADLAVRKAEAKARPRCPQHASDHWHAAGCACMLQCRDTHSSLTLREAKAMRPHPHSCFDWHSPLAACPELKETPLKDSREGASGVGTS